MSMSIQFRRLRLSFRILLSITSLFLGSCAVAIAGTPTCSVTSPTADISVAIGGVVNFQASALDPEKRRLRIFWDFGGGADIRPTVLNPGDVVFDQTGQFVVTLTVVDVESLRCTDTVSIKVGNPAIGLPQNVSKQPAPGSNGSGDSQHVVLPFSNLGMHCGDYHPMQVPH